MLPSVAGLGTKATRGLSKAMCRLARESNALAVSSIVAAERAVANEQGGRERRAMLDDAMFESGASCCHGKGGGHAGNSTDGSSGR
jgi:hypothetical protein